MMKTLFAFLISAIIALGACACPAEEKAEAVRHAEVSVHDPSVIRAEDGKFYIFGSHMAAAVSDDLISWKLISRDAHAGCTLVENVREQMKEALTWAHTDTFWAPDVHRLKDGRYAMYYCACEGSSPLSALGLAIADKPEGPYVDQGVFLKSGMPGYNATLYPNVVDPCVFTDKLGGSWMVYGSYSGGIFILRMDDGTGLPLEGQGYGKRLLGKNHARIEGPYILYSPETDYYYLFLSFGGLEADGGYNIRVCRSREPDGPYEDSMGRDMTQCGGMPGTFFHDPDYEPYGVKMMGGYRFDPAESDVRKGAETLLSPGHNSAFYEPETGRTFIIFHTRYASRGDYHSVRVHLARFNEDLWPVMSPVRYSGESGEAPEVSARPGKYKVLFHEHDINRTAHVSVTAVLRADGSVDGAVSGAWESDQGGTARFVFNGDTYKGVFIRGYDEAQGAFVSCFTALNEKGEAVWGIRTDGEDSDGAP